MSSRGDIVYNILEGESQYDTLKAEVQQAYSNITFVNNFYLICDKIKNSTSDIVNYVECGVFNGGTLIPVTLFSETIDKTVNITGVDSFKGFPPTYTTDHNDSFRAFTEQKDSGLITVDNYNKAVERCNKSTETFTSAEYFGQVERDIQEFSSKNRHVNLLVGYFADVLPQYTESIDVLHLDCDLYESYLDCLNNLYDNIVPGGVIIFDEYYSHKYPGARTAVDSFFENKNDGQFQRYLSPHDYQRWCWVKD